jgi:hypothetical protein
MGRKLLASEVTVSFGGKSVLHRDMTQYLVIKERVFSMESYSPGWRPLAAPTECDNLGLLSSKKCREFLDKL